MIKRTLFFGNPAYLSTRNAQLVVKLPDSGDEKLVPIEDIGMVVLEHPQISITHGLMNALIENNAAVLWCDDKHMPNGLMMPMTANHTYTEKIRHQLQASEPLKKNLWKQTVQAKINNQKAVLIKHGLDYEPLVYFAKSVGSGDPDNYEARAAAFYWDKYFRYIDQKSKRHRDGPPPNNLLNYGYAILRGVIARNLVSSGCLPAVGIFHRNKYNAFCLADDIMEPFRPYVDDLVIDVVSQLDEIPDVLTKEIKAKLLIIPTLDILIEGQNSPLMVGSQRTTASLMSCFEGHSRKLLYPEK